jgi:hypothetical protein
MVQSPPPHRRLGCFVGMFVDPGTVNSCLQWMAQYSTGHYYLDQHQISAYEWVVLARIAGEARRVYQFMRGLLLSR